MSDQNGKKNTGPAATRIEQCKDGTAATSATEKKTDMVATSIGAQEGSGCDKDQITREETATPPSVKKCIDKRRRRRPCLQTSHNNKDGSVRVIRITNPRVKKSQAEPRRTTGLCSQVSSQVSGQVSSQVNGQESNKTTINSEKA